MIDRHAFYKLQQPHSDEEYLVYGVPSWDEEFGRASWSEGVNTETISCPVYPGHQRAGRRVGILSVVLPSERVGDFVWTWYSDCLITDKTLRLFRDAGLTGFTVNPVEIGPTTEGGKRLATLPTLWELVIVGRGGDADPKSGIHLIYMCPHCGLTRFSSFRNGIVVDQQAWDGSDLFTITGYPFILVTERVKELAIKHGLTNCALIPSQDLVWGSIAKPEDI